MGRGPEVPRPWGGSVSGWFLKLELREGETAGRGSPHEARSRKRTRDREGHGGLRTGKTGLGPCGRSDSGAAS